MLANAVRYSHTQSKVEIMLSEDESTAYITVFDDGPGIPEGEQPYIFDRFFRGRNSKIEGSGLGLSIAQEITMIHGGEIRLQSDGRQGSTFTLELPKILRP